MAVAPPCPQCGQQAPIIYRGVIPTCTACGALRAPFAGPSVNLAGQPSKLGGTFAHVAGWIVLVVGLSLALGLGLLAGALGGVGIGLGVGLPIGIISLALGLALVLGGRSLRRTGSEEAQATRLQAVFALAAHRGGILSAIDVAHVLNLHINESDALLTELAKKDPDHVGVEIDDEGRVFYRFAPPGQTLKDVFPDWTPAWPNVRVAPEAHAGQAPSESAARVPSPNELAVEEAAYEEMGARRVRRR